MLYSMTGYGDVQYEAEGISFLVEVKSLNNRFLKTTIKLPDTLAFAEPEIERVIREELCRGAVTFVLHMRFMAEDGPCEINQAAIRGYLRNLEQLVTLSGKNSLLHIDLATLLQMPGACQPRTFSESEHEKYLHTISQLTRQALGKLRHMRAKEGQTLHADLRENCRSILKNLDALSQLTGSVVERYRQKLQSRVNALLSEANVKLDEEVLAREVALFADRCDINEEISRLRSHLEQFESICQDDQQAGRRLDFITQELLREANTIASKANDAKISHHVVEIKVAIDRLKEQVQNIE